VVQFSRAMSSSGYEESNLDLSGRFGEGGLLLPKLVHASTQTSLSDDEILSAPVCSPIDRATSTEGRSPNCILINLFYLLIVSIIIIISCYYHYRYLSCSKGKILPYLLPSVGPGADPAVQAVSPQVTVSHPRR